jgi:hypothetical protein
MTPPRQPRPQRGFVTSSALGREQYLQRIKTATSRKPKSPKSAALKKPKK